MPSLLSPQNPQIHLIDEKTIVIDITQDNILTFEALLQLVSFIG